MGNATRCPKCNMFGNADLDNYCRRCDLEIFKDKFHTLCNGSEKMLASALLEVGAKRVDDVKRQDRSIVANIIKRRTSSTRRKNLVQDSSPLESHGMEFALEPSEYKAEKEVPAIEY